MRLYMAYIVNLSKRNFCMCVMCFFPVKQRVHLLHNAHICSRWMIINSKIKRLSFHSDCLSPLWKVSPVVTKTTIQQLRMNVAHS